MNVIAQPDVNAATVTSARRQLEEPSSATPPRVPEHQLLRGEVAGVVRLPWRDGVAREARRERPSDRRTDREPERQGRGRPATHFELVQARGPDTDPRGELGQGQPSPMARPPELRAEGGGRTVCLAVAREFVAGAAPAAHGVSVACAAYLAIIG